MRRALALVLALWAGEASACRLALLFALDVSSSVDAREDRQQREGLATALVSPDVLAAFLDFGPVTIGAFEWSGKYQQDWILDWTDVTSEAALRAAAARIAASVRVEEEYPTSLGYALGHAAIALRDGPDCGARTLDVSGDGANNDGFPPGAAYANFPFEGVTVNGLVVGGAPQVAAYYRGSVIRGPGAFVEVATDYADYARAMERKLLRELAPRAVGLLAK